MPFILRHQTQSGTALVFSLLILLIMTIIGVATLSGTQMQERMAGNVAVQSQAFESASAGVSDALRFGMNEFFGDPDASPSDLGDPRCTTKKISDWRDASDNSVPRVGAEVSLPLLEGTLQTVTLEYQLQAECFQDPGLDTSVAPAEGYVTSLGRVTANDEIIATREVEVRVDDFRIDGLSAIRVEGDATVDYAAANSNRYFISGSGGSAVTASTVENAADIVTAIGSAGNGTRLANYEGGVSASKYDPPFSEAWQLARFVLEIKAFLEFHGLTGSDIPTTQVGSDECVSSLLPDGVYPDMGLIRPTGGTLNVTGGKNFEGITYVEGDLDMKGSAEGAGMVIAEGDVTWAGTDQFNGLIITLGGDLAVGGGGAAETNGMLYVANLDLAALSNLYYSNFVSSDGNTYNIKALATPGTPGAATDWQQVLDAIDALGNPADVGIDATEYRILDDAAGYTLTDGFGETSVAFTGGGGHTITYDCDSFDNARRILKACGQSAGDGDDTADGSFGFEYDGLGDPWADQGCDTPGEGGTIQSLRSWRENLGWRELLGSTP